MLERLAVFLPKGTGPQDPADGTALVRHPSCTRPLSMSNTDIKLLANAMTIALTLNLSDQACLRGRDMTAHINERKPGAFVSTCARN
eukprot:9358547-Pyramimonas_sp.AAC.1